MRVELLQQIEEEDCFIKIPTIRYFDENNEQQIFIDSSVFIYFEMYASAIDLDVSIYTELSEVSKNKEFIEFVVFITSIASYEYSSAQSLPHQSYEWDNFFELLVRSGIIVMKEGYGLRDAR